MRGSKRGAAMTRVLSPDTARELIGQAERERVRVRRAGMGEGIMFPWPLVAGSFAAVGVKAGKGPSGMIVRGFGVRSRVDVVR